MTDYHGFFWAALFYFAVMPGLTGAGIWGVCAWRKRRTAGAAALGALKGFVLVAGLGLLLIVAVLRY